MVSLSVLHLWAESSVCNTQDSSVPWTWRGAGISHNEVPREGPGGQSLTEASGEPGHPVLPGTESRPMTQIAFVAFGGNKGQRQECGGPKRQRREEYIFKLSFFSLMGKVKLRVQEKNCPISQSLHVARVRIGTLSKVLSDFEMDALPSLHTDIKLNDTQSLCPRRP